MTNSKIITNIKLEELALKDVNKTYLLWMNDSEIFKYSKQSYKKHSLRQIKEFVLNKKKSKNEFLYKIVIYKNKKNKHVGNIKKPCRHGFLYPKQNGSCQAAMIAIFLCVFCFGM